MPEKDLVAQVAEQLAYRAQHGQLPQFPLSPVRRTMTLSDALTPFGCCNFFDPCTEELMTLHFMGQLPLLDWMGYVVTDECYKSVEFMTFNRPESESYGHISDPCADPNGMEQGAAQITVEEFGRYGRIGPVRDIYKPMRYCVTEPRRRLDGTLITSEMEWDMLYATNGVIGDIAVDVITGNAAVAGQFDGLQRWVRTGYPSAMLDSIVIDWNGNGMAGGAGITWNGNAVAATFDIVDVLLAAYRRIRTRMGWAPRLRNQRLAVGDMILVIPTHMAQCLLDFYTCWSVCDGAEYNEVNLNSYEARQFRTQLNGGMFGNGRIFLDGLEIPLLAYDYGLLDEVGGTGLADFYFLTGQAGNARMWEGQHLSATVAAAENPDQGYFSTDGGRMLGRIDTENLCRTLKVWMRPRLFCYAPWAQIRFQDVLCTTADGPISPDPESQFNPAYGEDAVDCAEEEQPI